MTDEEIKALAEDYVNGVSIEIIKAQLCFTDVKLKRVLKMAKAMYPELDWPKRPSPSPSPTNDYVEMKDGKPGSRGVRPGSIIRGRK